MIHPSLGMVMATPLFAAFIGIVIYIFISGLVSWFGLGAEDEE
jgi:hypothetical protein